uniref:uncharacterized protein LOC122583323 n=1 Tax=Erigeron canadensis TaxID=72917 RepID=UPI001CB93C8D|nr:uncharacterized protein LOC122583323 [Erigeron canadensis]
MAFPVVEMYVKNAWAKFGLKKVMMNTSGFFFFQFESKEGMLQVLEKGPWMIRSIPIFLNEWNPNVSLAKVDMTNVPVRVKLYDVPLAAYTEDGLSMLASKLGQPILLDTYTSHMCVNSWGRHSYARALIEIDATRGFKENLVIGIPNVNGEGFSKETVSIEYEWRPPHCTHCNVFGHKDNNCPMQVKNSEKLKNNARDSNISFGSDDNEVEDVYDEQADFVKNNIGASTPKQPVSHVLHTQIIFKDEKKDLLCSFVYAHNRYSQRRELWRNLDMHKVYVHNNAWCILGDFNADSFMGVVAIFQPYRISDHSPAILRLPRKVKFVPRPFKFSNVLIQDPGFSQVVASAWKTDVQGFQMYRVVKMLKSLKKPLRKLLYDKGNLHRKVELCRKDLDEVQKLLDSDPFNSVIREDHATCLNAFNEALLDEERFLKQKAKVEWLLDGDDVKNAFIAHYTQFLGQSAPVLRLNSLHLFDNRLSQEQALLMISEVTDDEVKRAMFSMGDDKSPGPDGFSAGFFKATWSIIGVDVIKAIKEFFSSSNLLKELNHTVIALLPKVKTPTFVTDFRPISLCNVLFKCITKILSNRIKNSLKDLAYDTVDWGFLKRILLGFGFHPRMVSWIMECATTTTFSVSINGTTHGYFQGKRGLRQGDPLSPYLFTLVMEVLNLILKRQVAILNVLSFDEGTLPVKYLGVPLVSSRLRYRDCRLQLINSVIASMHVYWSSAFILPSQVIHEIEQMMRNFLWSSGEYKRGQSKVAWEVVCLPKTEGGLGIRRIEAFNNALISVHIRNIVAHKESL